MITDMGKSLQDQLISAGLATKGQAKKVRQEKRKKRKKRGKKPPPPDALKAKIVRDAADKARRDRELERERATDRARRERVSQVEQMIAAHRLDRADAEVAHRFVVGTAVKQIYVTAAQHAGLTAGRLRIARTADGFELVDAEAARAIAARDADAIVATPAGGDGAEGEDGYEGFEVPDDLMW